MLHRLRYWWPFMWLSRSEKRAVMERRGYDSWRKKIEGMSYEAVQKALLGP